MGEQGEIFSFTVSEAGTLSSFNEIVLKTDCKTTKHLTW
jgi:hypothetical protein